jgi:hypothetical protein
LRPCSSTHNKLDDFHQSFKGGFIIGYVFSFIFSVMITSMFYSKCAHWVHQLKKRKSIIINKAKELGTYICSITSRRTQTVVNHMHELLNSQMVHNERKEVLNLFIISFKHTKYSIILYSLIGISFQCKK